MPVRRRLAALAALAATAVCLAAPAPALAQSAGDDQYEDPFAGQNGGGDQDQGGQQPAATATPAPAQAPSTTTTTPAPATAAPSTTATAPAGAVASGQPELPRTGLDTGPVLLLGTVLLAGGVALRVRLRERR